MKYEAIESLNKVFSADRIKHRLGPGGREMAYLETHSVVRRLNEALHNDWSFDVVAHHIYDDEVVVVGSLTTHTNPPVTKTDIGAQHIRRDNGTGRPLALGDDIKAACSDAIKRCARLLGVGLFLYEHDDVQLPSADWNRHGISQGNEQGTGNENRRSEDNNEIAYRRKQAQGLGGTRGQSAKISSAQLGKLHELANEIMGGDWQVFADKTRQRFGSTPEQLSRRQASEVIGEMVKQSRQHRDASNRGAA